MVNCTLQTFNNQKSIYLSAKYSKFQTVTTQKISMLIYIYIILFMHVHHAVHVLYSTYEILDIKYFSLEHIGVNLN